MRMPVHSFTAFGAENIGDFTADDDAKAVIPSVPRRVFAQLPQPKIMTAQRFAQLLRHHLAIHMSVPIRPQHSASH